MSTKIREKRASSILEQKVGPLTFGKLMRSIRLSISETQEVFSRKLKISKQQLSDIENGRKAVSVKSAAKYADILGYSQDQFIKLCLEDLLERNNLKFKIEVLPLKARRMHTASPRKIPRVH